MPQRSDSPNGHVRWRAVPFGGNEFRSFCDVLWEHGAQIQFFVLLLEVLEKSTRIIALHMYNK